MWFDVATNLISALTNAGVGTVIGHIVEANTPDDLKRTTRILTKVGAAAITAVIADLASRKIESDLRSMGEELGLIEDTVDSTAEEVKEETDE